jgi:hypothetical protein
MKRLTDKHPTSKKVDKLLGLLEELNLEIHIGPYDTVCIVDKENCENNIYMRDNESSEPVSSIPPMFEYKLVIPE